MRGTKRRGNLVRLLHCVRNDTTRTSTLLPLLKGGGEALYLRAGEDREWNKVQAMKDKEYYAHSREGKPPEDWHRLEDHLKEVAEMARKFEDNFGAGDWGHLAGLWHDKRS